MVYLSVIMAVNSSPMISGCDVYSEDGMLVCVHAEAWSELAESRRQYQGMAVEISKLKQVLEKRDSTFMVMCMQ